MKRFGTGVLICLAAASQLPADFSYQQTSTVTGGVMATMMKVAGVFSKKAREPIRSTIAVKNGRMADRTGDTATIIDVNAETITTVDYNKKTYSTMTFAQMKQMLEEAYRKAHKADDPQMTLKVSADKTGKTQQIGGLDAKEVILKIEMQMTDPKSKDSGSMLITTDSWIASGVNGYSEVRDLYTKMAEKLNWTPSGSAFMAQPDIAKGMADAYKEMAKLDGVPVLQMISMGAGGQPGAQGSAQPSQPAESAKAEEPEEKPSVGGVLGGALGGRFGRFGRKKSQPKEEKKEEPPAQQANGGSPGSLLEMRTELTGFSAASVDDSLFAVPAGFKQVEAKH